MVRSGFLLAGGFLALALLSGCSSVPGAKGASLFPNGHKLTSEAKNLRYANAGARALPRELEKQPLPPYTVEPGDVLLVQPADLDSPARLPGDQPVLLDGTINLGKYGHLQVGGKTVIEIEQLVKGAIEAKTKDAGAINVRLVSRQSKVFYVVGEVNAPGAFPLQGRETVLDAIMTAGGLRDRASQNNIILIRPSHPADCRTVLPVCFKDIVQLGDTSTNYQIAPGDRIFVPSQGVLESLTGGRCHKTPCMGSHAPCPVPADPNVPVAPCPTTTGPLLQSAPIFRASKRATP